MGTNRPTATPMIIHNIFSATVEDTVCEDFTFELLPKLPDSSEIKLHGGIEWKMAGAQLYVGDSSDRIFASVIWALDGKMPSRKRLDRCRHFYVSMGPNGEPTMTDLDGDVGYNYGFTSHPSTIVKPGLLPEDSDGWEAQQIERFIPAGTDSTDFDTVYVCWCSELSNVLVA